MPSFVPANTVIIGIGSNIDPRTNIRKATKLLSQRCRLIAVSRFLKTKPIGFRSQNDFLNGAAVIATTLSRPRLKAALKKIETSLGRIRQERHYGPRTIDLDILIWNGKVVGKDFYTRNFTRQSVLELMPGLSHKTAARKRS